MFGDDIWCVTLNGTKIKGDMTRKQAEALAEQHQKGFCKHKDFRDYVEVKRDREMINAVDKMYHNAKRGEMQKYEFVEWRDD